MPSIGQQTARTLDPHRSNSIPSMQARSIVGQHTVDEIAQRAPEVLTRRQIVLVDEQHVVLEARVEMWFKAEMGDNWIMVTVNVSVDAV